MNNTARQLCIVISVWMLSGCVASQPVRDPAYAPPRPALPETSRVNNGAIYQTGFGVRLFEDQRARRVGDILTITLQETTNATKSNSTKTAKDNEVDIAGPTLLGGPVTKDGKEFLAANLDSNQEFEGSGESSQSNRLTGNITVTVVEVLPNGYLMVRGEKVLTLNRGDEFVRLSGIVRPVDIRSNNTVLSTQVADAQIIYSGSGEVADASKHGWLSKFFLAFWPF
ncbi:MAG: flagellar basal body L-ring protein FlgH [Proteobacteria bacterium]|nr:MAG: flagellar basal body L-ring protein FlgH [Pseudomonadota bacterium]